MIQRFDHAVIGIPDLDEGMAAFRQLGLDVTAGGRHPSLGTRNAIVRFGLDYLELLSVEYPDKARERGPFGADLLHFLDTSSGLVGYVLAGAALQDQADGFQTLGIGADGPFEMDRIRPDGRRLEWRLVVPGGTPWRRPWPYLIDWVTPESDLLSWDPPGEHACAATGVAGVDLVVDDLKASRQIYQIALGLQAETPEAPSRDRNANSLSYRLGSFRLRLLEPTAAGPVADELEELGMGPYRLLLATSDLTTTAAVLSANGILYSQTLEGLDLDPSAAAGARIRFVPR